MKGQNFSTDQGRYPLLYWTTFAYVVGIPNFVHFDVTGRTSNAINLTSISNVILAVIAGYLLVVMVLLDRRPLIVRKIGIQTGLWLFLLCELLVATLLEPSSRLSAHTTMSLLLSLFRLGQWVVAFCLIVALYSRTPAERATQMIVGLIGRASWVWLAMVWLILPIMPAQVYGAGEDSGPETVRRLGGQLIAPAHVTLLGSMAFFYALFFFPRGPRKWAACTFALVTIVLTGARAQQAGFLMALFLYAIVLTRKPAIRWAMIGITTLALLVGVSLADRVMKYVARGQSVQTLASLNDRTRVWEAGLDAVKERPIIGYGYSVGARNAIRDHWKYAHWIPPHAHNEFIQAALDGGIIACAIFIWLYGRVLWSAVVAVRRGPLQLFLLLAALQFALNTLTGSAFTFGYGGTSGVLLLCCVGVLAGASDYVTNRSRVRRKVSSFDRTLQPTAV